MQRTPTSQAKMSARSKGTLCKALMQRVFSLQQSGRSESHPNGIRAPLMPSSSPGRNAGFAMPIGVVYRRNFSKRVEGWAMHMHPTSTVVLVVAVGWMVTIVPDQAVTRTTYLVQIAGADSERMPSFGEISWHADTDTDEPVHLPSISMTP